MTLQIKQFLTEEDAVTPVIGIILMVAITVILAAVVGVFVIGTGDAQQETPAGVFDFDYTASSGELVVTKVGGETFDTTNTFELTVTYTNVTAGGPDEANFALPTTAGATVGPITPAPGSEVDIIWTVPDGSKTQIVGSFAVPN